MVQVTAIRLGLTATGGRPDEDVFQASIAVAIQPSSGDRFPRSHDPALLEFIFRTHMGHHGEPDVTPKLLSRPKSVGGIDGRHDQRTSNRAQLGNRPQQTEGSMLSAFY